MERSATSSEPSKPRSETCDERHTIPSEERPLIDNFSTSHKGVHSLKIDKKRFRAYLHSEQLTGVLKRKIDYAKRVRRARAYHIALTAQGSSPADCDHEIHEFALETAWKAVKRVFAQPKTIFAYSPGLSLQETVLKANVALAYPEEQPKFVSRRTRSCPRHGIVVPAARLRPVLAEPALESRWYTWLR